MTATLVVTDRRIKPLGRSDGLQVPVATLLMSVETRLAEEMITTKTMLMTPIVVMSSPSTQRTVGRAMKM